MELNKVKQRLDSFKATNNKSTNKKEKIDYKKIYWKPSEEGKYQIRFVPSIHTELVNINPFHEAMVHYGLQKFPIMSLTNWGEEDPVVEIANKLKSTGDTEDWKLGNQLSPKLRVFAPVIVRGEEEKGVRIFEFSQTLFRELLAIADDDDYGDFTDVEDGFDFTLTATKAGERPGFEISLRPKRKPSPLSDDSNQVETWLNEQPSLLEVKFKYQYDKLKEVLENHLGNGDEEEEKPEPIAFANTKTDAKSKFNDMFTSEKVGEKDDVEVVEEEDDDLPF